MRIEAPDRLECVTEEVEAHRPLGTWRIDVDDAPANGEIAGIDNRAGARIAIVLKEELQLQLSAEVNCRTFLK